jgi:hypothetical protein
VPDLRRLVADPPLRLGGPAMSATSLQALISVTSIPRIEREQAWHEVSMAVAEFWHTDGVEHRYWRNRARTAIRLWREHYERPERAAFEAAVAKAKQQSIPKAA